MIRLLVFLVSIGLFGKAFISKDRERYTYIAVGEFFLVGSPGALVAIVNAILIYLLMFRQDDLAQLLARLTSLKSSNSQETAAQMRLELEAKNEPDLEICRVIRSEKEAKELISALDALALNATIAVHRVSESSSKLNYRVCISKSSPR